MATSGSLRLRPARRGRLPTVFLRLEISCVFAASPRYLLLGPKPTSVLRVVSVIVGQMAGEGQRARAAVGDSRRRAVGNFVGDLDSVSLQLWREEDGRGRTTSTPRLRATAMTVLAVPRSIPTTDMVLRHSCCCAGERGGRAGEVWRRGKLFGRKERVALDVYTRGREALGKRRDGVAARGEAEN